MLFTHRKARLEDLPIIIAMFMEDELGKTREHLDHILDENYINAFHRIKKDPNQYLMVVENGNEIVGSCQLTLIPSLTFIGKTRLQIEAVHIFEKHRGKKIGEWMIKQAIAYGKEQGAAIVQLTTNKKRLRAKKFYEKLGFKATHEGMKLDSMD